MRAKTLILGLLATTFIGSTAFAETVPVAGNKDSRIRYVEYEPNQVYTIYGHFRQAVEIDLGSDETITQAALGDTISWEIAPVNNVIFLKPREQAGSTNLIVLTQTASGAQRSYRFQLIMNKGPEMYAIKFKYAGDSNISRESAELAAKMAELKAQQGEMLKSALDHAVIEGKRNLNYWFRGDAALEPSEVSDNGEFTVLRFPGHKEIPAIFGVNSDGKEAIIDYDVREDYVVIHGLYKEMRLRQGNSTLIIVNKTPLPNGREERTGTVSPMIERTVISNDKPNSKN